MNVVVAGSLCFTTGSLESYKAARAIVVTSRNILTGVWYRTLCRDPHEAISVVETNQLSLLLLLRVMDLETLEAVIFTDLHSS